MEKKLVLKIACNTWENASRDVRELSVIQELGADVLVMAKGEKTGIKENVSGFSVYRMSTRPLSNKIPNEINRFLSVFIWAYKARQFKPDVISGHDLIPLFIGWLSTWFCKKEKRPKLVYDSHEFTIYAGKRSKVQAFLIMYLERFLIRKCEFTIEVNDLIADEVQRIHKLKDRPIVVRNIPAKWNIDSDVCKGMRKEIMKSFRGYNTFLIMYHGAIMPNRGIETLIHLVSENPNISAIVLGNGEESFMKKLRNEVEKFSISERFYFHKAVKQNELWKYVGAADVGMILAPALNKNHLYSLPNKFFENIQAETPVICPHYPAMEQLIEQYNNGLVCNPMELKDINHCIERLRLDKELYQNYKENTKKAKEILCWERERTVLEEAYRRLL